MNVGKKSSTCFNKELFFKWDLDCFWPNFQGLIVMFFLTRFFKQMVSHPTSVVMLISVHLEELISIFYNWIRFSFFNLFNASFFKWINYILIHFALWTSEHTSFIEQFIPAVKVENNFWTEYVFNLLLEVSTDWISLNTLEELNCTLLFYNNES